MGRRPADDLDVHQVGAAAMDQPAAAAASEEPAPVARERSKKAIAEAKPGLKQAANASSPPTKSETRTAGIPITSPGADAHPASPGEMTQVRLKPDAMLD